MSTLLTWENTSKVFKTIKDALANIVAFKKGTGLNSCTAGCTLVNTASGKYSFSFGSGLSTNGGVSVSVGGGLGGYTSYTTDTEGEYKNGSPVIKVVFNYLKDVCNNIDIYNSDYTSIIGKLLSIDRNSDNTILFKTTCTGEVGALRFMRSNTNSNFSFSAGSNYNDNASVYSVLLGQYNSIKTSPAALIAGYYNVLSDGECATVSGKFNYVIGQRSTVLGVHNYLNTSNGIAIGARRNVYSYSTSIYSGGLIESYKPDEYTINEDLNKITIIKYSAVNHFKRFSDFIGCHLESSEDYDVNIIDSVEYDTENLSDTDLFNNTVTLVLKEPFTKTPTTLYLAMNIAKNYSLNLGNNLAMNRDFVMGEYNIARGWRSTVVGFENEGCGGQVHIFGYGSTAKSDNSVLAGGNLVTNNGNEFAYGHNNISHTGENNADITKLSIGANNKNVIEVMRNGDTYLYGNKIFLRQYDSTKVNEEDYLGNNLIINEDFNDSLNETAINPTTNTNYQIWEARGGGSAVSFVKEANQASTLYDVSLSAVNKQTCVIASNANAWGQLWTPVALKKGTYVIKEHVLRTTITDEVNFGRVSLYAAYVPYTNTDIFFTNNGVINDGWIETEFTIAKDCTVFIICGYSRTVTSGAIIMEYDKVILKNKDTSVKNSIPKTLVHDEDYYMAPNTVNVLTMRGNDSIVFPKGKFGITPIIVKLTTGSYYASTDDNYTWQGGPSNLTSGNSYILEVIDGWCKVTTM